MAYIINICDIIDIDLRRLVTGLINRESLRYAVLIYGFHVQTQ